MPTPAILLLRNNIEKNRGSPEVVLHKKSGDIFDLRSGATAPRSVATSADTRVITAIFDNIDNFELP